MQSGPRIDPAIRELARRIAWQADIMGIGVDVAPADMMERIHAGGFFLNADPFQVSQAIGYAHSFRQVGVNIAEGMEHMTLGQLQQQQGLAPEFAIVHVKYGVEGRRADGGTYMDVASVAVHADPGWTVARILSEANNIARNAPRRTESDEITMIGEVVGVGPVA